MKFIYKLFGHKSKGTVGNKSPVYVFFAEAGSEEKTKAYKKALRGASEDQMSTLSKYHNEFAHN